MRNPWVAIESTVEPQAQARLIARARERVLDGDPPPRVLRPVVLESWQRSSRAGLAPQAVRMPPRLDPAELEERRRRHPLHAAMPLVRSLLLDVAEDARHVVAVADDTGHLLWVEGNRSTERAATDIGFVAGADWSEGTTGTNAPGTALAADHPIQVFAAEHFQDSHRSWMCAAAPVHDPDDGRLLGAVDLTAWFDTAHPSTLALAAAAARAVEAHLRAGQALRDARAIEAARGLLGGGAGVLVASPGGRLLGDDQGGAARIAAPTEPGRLRLGRRVVEAEPLPAVPGYWLLRPHAPSRPRTADAPAGASGAVGIGAGPADGDGPAGASAPARTRAPGRATAAAPARVELRLLGATAEPVRLGDAALAVSPRQLELCALLALHPDGLTSARTRELLYGEQEVAEVTVRAELSRLRRALGPALAARPYRFAAPVATDAERVERLLHAGAVRAAVQSYAGPLLPASQSPCLEEERDRLHGELRAALLASDDADALFAWIQAPHGARDAAVARRLTALVEPGDPRHAAAVAAVDADLFATT